MSMTVDGTMPVMLMYLSWLMTKLGIARLWWKVEIIMFIMLDENYYVKNAKLESTMPIRITMPLMFHVCNKIIIMPAMIIMPMM